MKILRDKITELREAGKFSHVSLRRMWGQKPDQRSVLVYQLDPGSPSGVVIARMGAHIPATDESLAVLEELGVGPQIGGQRGEMDCRKRG